MERIPEDLAGTILKITPEGTSGGVLKGTSGRVPKETFGRVSKGTSLEVSRATHGRFFEGIS